MEEPNQMLTDKEIQHVEKQLKRVFGGAIAAFVLLVGMMCLSSCSAPPPTGDQIAIEQAAFLLACREPADCPGELRCSLGSDAMPGRCTRDCALPADCASLLPARSNNDVSCDAEEFLCVARCSRTVACPDALPACALGTCAATCDGMTEEACWYNGTAQ